MNDSIWSIGDEWGWKQLITGIQQVGLNIDITTIPAKWGKSKNLVEKVSWDVKYNNVEYFFWCPTNGVENIKFDWNILMGLGVFGIPVGHLWAQCMWGWKPWWSYCWLGAASGTSLRTVGASSTMSSEIVVAASTMSSRRVGVVTRRSTETVR